MTPSRKLEIAHVLFIDIVGYSKLLLNEQSGIIAELNEIVRRTEPVRLAESAGNLLRLPTGDGVALIFRDSPEAPVECAIEIADALKDYPRLRLRMGIHSGPVQEVTDVSGRSNVTGAGINIAQRVMDCGDAGHILLSKHVAEDLENDERWRACLHDLGEVVVKHGVSLNVVSLHDDSAGNAQVPAKIALQRRAARKVRIRVAALAAVALLLAFTLAGYFIWRTRPGISAPAAILDEKGIAVLPFENLSAEKENAFFADGIQDDLLTNLARIKDLRVISRTSVLPYRNRAHNLRDIGKALGVANILEGSVRKVADRIALNVQLIDARNDHHIWANHYDRTLADALSIEGELAREIADALKTTLTADEKSRIEVKPTENPDAWVIYLRAVPIERGPDTLLVDFKRAEQLFSEAVKLDPNFALAHAKLASTCAEIYHFYEPTEVWKTRARTEAEIALRLQPNLGEAHLAIGQCDYWLDNDYQKALAEFAITQKLIPNDGYVGMLVAAIQRRQGDWEGARRQFEAVQKLDPQNPNIVRNLLFTLTSMRLWPEAAIAAARFRALSPDSITATTQSGYVEFCWKGDTTALKQYLAKIPAGVDPDGSVTGCRWDVAMIDRDFARAAQVLAQTSVTEISYTNAGTQPKSFFAGLTALAAGNRAEADKNFAQALPFFTKAVEEAPQDHDRHASLGLLYAFMGKHDDAIREGRRAVELKPESNDALDGVLMSSCLALIYARVGENDLAIPLIERLLKTPGAVDSANYSITVNDLKHRWEWDPIRNDPRFQKLISTPP